MRNLTAFMDLSFGFALLDSHLTILAANGHFAAVVHREPAALPEKPLLTLLPEIKSVTAEKPHTATVLERPNGQTLAVDLVRTTENGKPAVLLFCRDLTQYRQLQEEKERQDKQLALFNQMVSVLHDGIFIADAQAMTLYVNDAFLSLSGTRWEDVVGKSVYQLMAEGIVSNSATAAVIETGKAASTINVYPRGKTCLVSGTPVFTDGSLTRVICVIRDLTELNSLRDKLHQARSLTLSYKRQLKEIEARQESKDILSTRSKIMKNVFEKALKVAAVDATVLLLGETGVGKDFLAKFIHDASERKKQGHFVKINCGAIPETLLESELFGYERGAFTGADKQGKAGLFEIAKHGTLFLDEIGEMPLGMQAKLLRVLQDGSFERVGGNDPIRADVRIIGATNRVLPAEVAAGRFREDLFYRLNVVPITLPPLRDRKEDIPLLVANFLKQFAKENAKPERELTSEAMEAILACDWPGNVRELRTAVEHGVVMATGAKIGLRDFPMSLRQAGSRPPGKAVLPTSGSYLNLHESEHRLIMRALDESKGNRTKAAQRLGISRRTLHRRLQELKITST
jgi:PAS domain S-box-containing protein